jgi:pimeloyl-ACP methyl ester carboxylesterase
MTSPARPVFIHGSGGGREAWAAQAARFAGAAILELPGHPSGSALPSASGYAEWVSSAVAGVPGPRVLVGHSLGGAVALHVAHDWPGCVDGLVLVTTGARLPVPDSAFARLRQDFPGECERVVRAGLVREDPGLVARGIERMLAAGPDSLEADYRACAGFDARGWLAEVDIPALVVAGSEDPLTPVWLAEELAGGIPGAVLAVVPGASHAVMEECPRTFDLLLGGFLARMEGEGTGGTGDS